jgi:hypothetical protein
MARELTDEEVFGFPAPSAQRELTDEEVFGVAPAAPAQDDQPGPVATGVAGGISGLLGLSESIFRTPEAIGRGVNFLEDTAYRVNQFLRRNLAPWAPELPDDRGPLIDTENDVVIKPFTTAADAIAGARESLADPALADTPIGRPFRRIAELGQEADTAFRSLIADRDPTQVKELLSQPEAWTAFIGQAVPSLYAAMKSGGSPGFIAWLEGMEGAANAKDFERRTGIPVSDQEFTQAVAQAATINALLEKTGVDKILGVRGTRGLGRRLAKTGGAAITESGTEGLQALNTNVAERLAFDPEKDLTEGVLPSMMGGFGAGAGAAGAVNIADAARGDPNIPTEADQGPAPEPRISGLLEQQDPDPVIVFPDGSTARKSEVDAAVANMSIEERARLFNLGAQDAPVNIAGLLEFQPREPMVGFPGGDVVPESQADERFADLPVEERARLLGQGAREVPPAPETADQVVARATVPQRSPIAQIIEERAGVRRGESQSTKKRAADVRAATEEQVGVTVDPETQQEKPLTAAEYYRRFLGVQEPSSAPAVAPKKTTVAKKKTQPQSPPVVAPPEGDVAAGAVAPVSQPTPAPQTGQTVVAPTQPQTEAGQQPAGDADIPDVKIGFQQEFVDGRPTGDQEFFWYRHGQPEQFGGFKSQDEAIADARAKNPGAKIFNDRGEPATEPQQPASAPAVSEVSEEGQQASSEQSRISQSLSQQREIEETSRFESTWQRLMSARGDQVQSIVNDLSDADARKVMDRLNAAPGDNPAVRQAVKAKLGDTTLRKEAVTTEESEQAPDQIAEEAQALNDGINTPGTKLYANPIEPVLGFVRKITGLSDSAFADYKKDLEATIYLFRKTKKAKGTGRGAESAWTYVPKMIGYSIDGQLRSLAKRHKSPTIERIADMFNARPGEGAAVGETYGEAVDAKSKEFENELFQALGKEFSEISEAGEKKRAQITRLVQNRDAIRQGTPIHDAAAKVAKLLDKMLKYSLDAGLKVGQMKDYFPRAYDHNKIMQNPTGFIKAATKAYKATNPELTDEEAQKMAEAWYQAETLSGLGVAEHPFLDLGNAIPKANFRKAREHVKQIDDIMREFLIQDPMEVLLAHGRKVARRAEWEKRFGGVGPDGKTQNAKWKELQDAMVAEGAGPAIPQVVSLIKAATGEIPANVPQSVRNAVSWVRALTVIKYLAHATVTSLSEPVIAGMRTGNLMHIPRAYWNSVKATANRMGAKNADMIKARQVAELIGVVVNHLSTDTVAAHRFNIDSGQQTSEWANRLASRSTVITGLHIWTEDNRTAMVKVGQKYIHHLADDLLANGKDKVARFELRDMGIPEAKQKAFAEWVQQFKEPDASTLSKEFENGSENAQLYRTALTRFINQVIMNPTHADRPYLAAHPVASVAYTLTSYLYAFHKNVLQRVGTMTKQAFTAKDLTPMQRLHFMAPLLMTPILVAVQYALFGLRDLWDDPKRVEERTETEKLLRAVSYAGLFGTTDPLMNIATSVKYERDIANALLGPYVGDVAKLAQDVIKAPSDRNSPNTNTHERQIAKDIYNVVIDPAAKTLLILQPVKPLAVVGTQAVASAGTREAFISAVAGESKDAGKSRSSRGSAREGRETRRSGR